jgi:hypothetical protein
MPSEVAMEQSEVGRPLLAHELVPRTVVVLGRQDRAAMYTVWVSVVGADFVAFLAGEVNTTFLAVRHPDGTLTDDTDQRILVFEYLGEI